MAVLFLQACTPTAQPIEFGTDPCAHCKMTIVDKPFAAEMVTQKGRVYKFDAIECMAQFIQENEDAQPIALLLVRDYNNPDDWVDAKSAYFLVSKALPSPMGGYLSAYPSEKAVRDMQALKGGEILNWEELKRKYHR